MIFQLTAKNCRVSERSHRHINKHLAKVSQVLPNITSDLVVLRLTIRKNIDKYHPPRARSHLYKNYSDSKPALAYFEGSITFRLSRNRFYVHFKGMTVDECVNLGFKRLFEGLEKYKDMHFPNESEYPDHSSIRGSSYG
jgi:hypothetical protein